MNRTLPKVVIAAALLAGVWSGCATVDEVAYMDSGSPGDAGPPDTVISFMEAGGATFDVDPTPEQDITVGMGQQTPSVTYNASANGSSLAVTWTVDQGAIGIASQGPSSTTTFVPSGSVGGLANVTATYDKATVSRAVLVKLTGSQNGGCPSSQIATTTTQLFAGGGIGGVGGEGCGGAVTDAPTLAALGSPVSNGSAQGLAFIYPYDKTVFPRGLLAPELMWSWSMGDADAIEISLATTSGSFTWSGTFARPAILQQTGGNFIRHPIPDDIWTMATNTAGTVIHTQLDQLVVSLTVAKGGLAYGPISETWTVAPGTLKGTVYYSSYGTRYSTSNWSNQVGASVLAIKHGATDPYLVTSKTQCQLCHSVAAQGSDLVAESDPYPGNGSDFDLDFDLAGSDAGSTSLPTVTGLYSWGGISPDGTLFFSNSSPQGTSPVATNGLEGATSTTSGLFALGSGSPVLTAAQIASQLSLSSQLGGALPEFSPDGKHVVFTFFKGGPGTDGKSADQVSLAVVDFDQTTKTFSNLRTLYTPTCAGCTAVAPFFTPSSDAVVFELNTVSNGLFAGTTATGDTSWENCGNLAGAQGELWWVDLATATPHRLDVTNGLGYLPTGPNSHGSDTTLQYDPTVAPIASGGYAWIAFMSRRMYGSLATINPWCTDTQSDVTTYAILSSTPSPLPKKVWVAAFDLNATPGTDPSHPGFYLPAQELLAGNFRAFWVLDPCESTGSSCQSGDECCGGYCESSADGGLVCGNSNGGCGGEGDTCASSGDCCGGLQCVGGHCDVIPVY